MKSHSWLQYGVIIFAQGKKMAFRPVGREANTDTISGAMEKVLRNLGLVRYASTGSVNVFGSNSGSDRIYRSL